MVIEWRPIEGYEGIYEVGSHGRVRRIAKGVGAVPGRVLAIRPDRKGYCRVALHSGGRRDAAVHRLVAAAFLPTPSPERGQVNHIDGDKANNAVTNLEWCTGLENIAHSLESGLRDGIRRGERNPRAKLTESQALEIFHGSGTSRDVAAQYGVSKSLVQQIRAGLVWAHVTKDWPQIEAELRHKTARPAVPLLLREDDGRPL